MKFSSKGENEMGDIRNKILTISGDPRSGKSTIVKCLVQILENMGYEVRIYESGIKFRDISQRRYSKMYPDRIDAKQADIQSDEEFAKERDKIDKEVDDWLKGLGNEINSEDTPNVIYIVDSRLAFHYMNADSFDACITVNDKVEAGMRAYKDKSKGPQDSYDTPEEAIIHTLARALAEIERFAEKGINKNDPNNFDYIKDTSHVTLQELPQLAREIYERAMQFWRLKGIEKSKSTTDREDDER